MEDRAEHRKICKSWKESEKMTEPVINQTGIKKKINPTGRDGEVLKCKSCRSFRHLLDDCLDSWEDMGNMDEEITE